jgi:hypothetical protein
MYLNTSRSALLGLVFASLAFAPAAAAPEKAEAVKPAKEKKICRRGVATGSIMPKSTCRTQAEWSQVDKQSQDDVENFRNRPQASRPGN